MAISSWPVRLGVPCMRATEWPGIKKALDEFEFDPMPVGEIVNGVGRHGRDSARNAWRPCDLSFLRRMSEVSRSALSFTPLRA